MGRKSSIHKLEPDVRSHIERRLREDQFSLTELIDDLKQAFPEQAIPSRSAIGRYRKSYEQVASRMKEQNEMARLLVSELGENPDERAGALMVQSISTLTTHAAFQAQISDEVDVDTVRHLARAAKDVLQARKLSHEERRAIEKAARDRLISEQREKLDELGRTGAISQEALATVIRAAYDL